MARDHRVKIDFYQVETEGSSLESLLETIRRLPNDERRNVEIQDQYIRLKEVSRGQQYWEGDLIRIRMDDLPLKASLSGETALFELEDDEGLGEETAFLYHPATKVLLLQRNRTGVSASKTSRYFEEKGGEEQPILLLPIFISDVVRRLKQFSLIRKFKIRMAGLRNLQVFRNQRHSVAAMAQLSREFEAPNIEVTLSMGHTQGSLLSEKVIHTARELLRASQNEEPAISKIVISGRTDDDDSETLDLLKFRMMEETSVRITGRRLFYSDRRNALRQAFQKRKSELEEMLAEPRE